MKIEFRSRTHLVVVVALGAITAVSLPGARRLGGSPPQAVQSPGLASEPDQWTPFGPGPLRRGGAFQSGRVSSIAVDPRDSAHWLVGVGNGGVWETRDSGGSWTPITDDAPTLSIGAVAFAPSDPDIVYVATGELAGGVGFLHVGVGLLKSVNGGQTWTLLGESNLARASVRRVLVDPNNANVLLAATGRGGFGRDAGEGAPAPPPFGILRAVDGGATWARTLAGQASALEADPTNFSRQYAAIADQRVGVNSISRDTPGAAPNGLYRSTNGG